MPLFFSRCALQIVQNTSADRGRQPKLVKNYLSWIIQILIVLDLEAERIGYNLSTLIELYIYMTCL